MDFKKLTKAIYELGDVIVSTCSPVHTRSNDLKIIGKVDEYEEGIEIIFEDDSTFWISKSNIEDVICTECKVQINYNNGITVCFDSTNA